MRSWLLVACLAAPLLGQGGVRAFRFKEAWLGDGRVLAPAHLLCDAQGRILALGEAIELPEGVRVVDYPEGVATPGLVEADAAIGMPGGRTANEQRSEITPNYRAADVVDLRDRGFERLVRDGITTVAVHPGVQNVISGIPAALKTASPEGGATVLDEDLGLAVTLGTSPARGNGSPRRGRPNLFTRIPNTRMGVVVLIRQAFTDAARAERARDADQARLKEALRGERRLFWRAQAAQEIRSAHTISSELGLPPGVLIGAIGAQREREMLAEWKSGVVFGPFRHVRSLDAEFRFSAPRALADSEVPFAFGQGSTGVGVGLRDHALFAMRGGLDEQAALEAITLAPARLLGVDDRVGSLAVGKHADIVVWTGRGPMDPGSAVHAVIMAGRVLEGIGGEKQ